MDASDREVAKQGKEFGRIASIVLKRAGFLRNRRWSSSGRLNQTIKQFWGSK
jgi:hypothetical protein